MRTLLVVPAQPEVNKPAGDLQPRPGPLLYLQVLQQALHGQPGPARQVQILEIVLRTHADEQYQRFAGPAEADALLSQPQHGTAAPHAQEVRAEQGHARQGQGTQEEGCRGFAQEAHPAFQMIAICSLRVA